MRSVIIVILVIISILLGCEPKINIEENNVDLNCFNDNPIEKYSWLDSTVTLYAQPNSGTTRVAVYEYNNKFFVAVENVLNSSPAGCIFDCNGKNLIQLGINYNDFYSSANLIQVILNINN